MFSVAKSIDLKSGCCLESTKTGTITTMCVASTKAFSGLEVALSLPLLTTSFKSRLKFSSPGNGSTPELTCFTTNSLMSRPITSIPLCAI